MSSNATKKAAGNGVKPNSAANGEYGNATAIAMHALVVRMSARLGRLEKNGTRCVRMTKMTSDCVMSDSTNQPVRKSVAPAWNTQSMTPNVAKSKIELIGPNMSMNRSMNLISQCAGLR